jgi:hypothetical protein
LAIARIPMNSMRQQLLQKFYESRDDVGGREDEADRLYLAAPKRQPAQMNVAAVLQDDERRFRESPGFARELWQMAQQSYSLDRAIGVRKFGPHHVVLQTSLSNIRLTTFFAGESEAKIIDPSWISRVESLGCEWKSPRIPPCRNPAQVGGKIQR